MYVTELRPDHSAVGVLEVQPSSLNPMGIVHGGALVTLADTVCGTAAFTTGHMCVTLDCSMQYLAPASGARITCTATPRKLGKTVLVYEAVLTDDTGRTVATGVYTFCQGAGKLTRILNRRAAGRACFISDDLPRGIPGAQQVVQPQQGGEKDKQGGPQVGARRPPGRRRPAPGGLPLCLEGQTEEKPSAPTTRAEALRRMGNTRGRAAAPSASPWRVLHSPSRCMRTPQ